MIRTIPLNKLVPSPRNVRRVTDEQADLQLKADIEARGLLQNLVVTAAGKPRGRYAVAAGGRRLRALQSLVDEGKLPATHEVCCLVLEPGSEVREVSLAENFSRLAMNPADECIAFQQLIGQGANAEGIARRFGLTVRFVEGRLRLAGLAPVVFEALGAGEISLDVAKAYAATPDRERQAHVFEQVSRGYGAAHPDSIRRMMTLATAGAGDRRALFVGEEAYVAAGGRVERDLFTDEDDARWLDLAILERLACEKMEALAAKIAAELGYASVRPTLDSWIGHSLTAGLRRVRIETPPLSEEESAAVHQLEGEIEVLAELAAEEGTEEPAREDAEARIRELGGQIEAIVARPPVLDEALKPSVVAFLVLGDDGRPKLDSSLYTELPEEEGPSPRERGEAISEESGGKADKPAGLSQRLVDELAMQRRDILAVHVARDPELALDLAIFLMVDRAARHWGERRGSSLLAVPPADPVPDLATPDAPATIARLEAAAALDRSWVDPQTIAARFAAFRALGEEARAAWLGHAVAHTLEASLHGPGPRACAFHDHLGQLLGIDVGRWWRPTGANYFDRVPKGVALAALEEVGGPELARRHAKAKKAGLAEACERIFAGDFIADAEVKEAALAWVPEVMRFVPVAPAAPDEREEKADVVPEAFGDHDDDLATPPWEVEEAA